MKKRIGKRERARNKNNQALDKAIEAGATERRIGKLLHLTGRTLVPSEKKSSRKQEKRLNTSNQLESRRPTSPSHRK